LPSSSGQTHSENDLKQDFGIEAIPSHDTIGRVAPDHEEKPISPIAKCSYRSQNKYSFEYQGTISQVVTMRNITSITHYLQIVRVL
jgi:hypothetical protein